MRCLVTGASGFIGGHLVDLLLVEKQEVTGIGRERTPDLSALGSEFAFAPGNLLDRGFIRKVLESVRPELVFHLAAQSYPGLSWKQPAETFEVNVVGTIGLFEEILASGLDPKVVVAGSSSEYGPSRDDRPIAESGDLLPSSPYAVSKLAQDHLCRLYHESRALKVVRCRPFFLIGPRKTGDVSSDFARGIVAIESQRQQELSVGTLEVVRDFLDVRDGVEAIWLLARCGQPGDVYNICSGRGFSLRDVLAIYKSLARVEIRERTDPGLIRPIEEIVKVGDPSKLCRLGWSPRRPIRQTLEDILDYWRGQEASGTAEIQSRACAVR